MKKYRFFYLAVGSLFCFLLYFNSIFFKGSVKYLGVTTSKEYKISSEKSATVKKIHVVPGEAVKKGDLLIELSSLRLTMEIDKLNNRIEVLKSDLAGKRKEVQSEIDYLKAQKGIKVEEIESDILKTKKELELNLKFVEQLKQNKNTVESGDQDPVQLEIASLEEKRRLHQKAMDIKIKDVLKKNEIAQVQLGNQLNLLEKEKEGLINEQNRLNKYATFDGVIENVYVKDNEEIQSYTNLASVNPTHPSSVVGYIVGKKSHTKKVGDIVEVASYDKRTELVKGEIIGLGAITELPAILQKSTSVKSYGLEVFIRIDDRNNLSTGQKVVIN